MVLLLLFLGVIIYLQYVSIQSDKKVANVCCYNTSIYHWFLQNIVHGLLIMRPYLYFYQYITKRFRKSHPDFYILGFRKCGTTTLGNYLTNLGFIGPKTAYDASVIRNKETMYFRGNLNMYFNKNIIDLNGYSMFWPFNFNFNFKSISSEETGAQRTCEKEKTRCISDMCFDGCPSYACTPWVRDMIHELHSRSNSTKDVKFIVLLRDPIERIESGIGMKVHWNEMYYNWLGYQWNDYFKLGSMKENINKLVNGDFCMDNYLKVPVDSFQKDKMNKMNKMMIKLPQFYNSVEALSLFMNESYYDQHIEWYLKKFDKSQFLFFEMKQIYKNNDSLHQALFDICKFLNVNVTETVKNKIYNLTIERKNQTPTSIKNKSKLSLETKDKLKRDFNSHNKRLYQIIEKQFDW